MTSRMETNKATKSLVQAGMVSDTGRMSSSASGTSGFTRATTAGSNSPTLSSRGHENLQLQNLNDRLAAYIDRVRSLETENGRLLLQVQSTQGHVTDEVTNLKKLYDQELSDARKLLDELAKEKARAYMQANKYKAESEDWLAKFHNRDQDCKTAMNEIHNLRGEITELQGKVSNYQHIKIQLDKDVAWEKAELATRQRQLAAAKKKLEEETLLRADLENRVQSLKEDLEFKTQVYAKELAGLRARETVDVDEVDSRTQKQYEAKLQLALQSAREENEERIQNIKSEVESLYVKKMVDLERALDNSMSVASTSRDDFDTLKRQLNESNSALTKHREQNISYEARIRTLENQMEQDRNTFSSELKQKESILRELRKIVNVQTKEYTNLLEIKITMDNEIMAYRKLLEGGEERLNVSPSECTTAGQTSQLSRGIKRKRMAASKSTRTTGASSSVTGYVADVQSNRSVEIKNIDPSGAYIELYNNSGKDVAIGGWKLVHTAEGSETAYQFYRSLVLTAGHSITVWSSNTGKTHTPPSDLVMTAGKIWLVANNMTTTLFDAEGHRVASIEMSKSVTRSSDGYADDSIIIDDETDGPDEKPCILM